MEIEATELQTEAKGFLRNTNATYSETLELIQADIRVRTTGEYFRNTTMRPGPAAMVRTGKSDDNVKTIRLTHPFTRLDPS